MGLHQSGFEVEGVDIAPQPRYPFSFHQGDAVEFILEHGHEYDIRATSPPCQFGTDCQRIQSNDHPNLIPATRDALIEVGGPYVIENVEGSREHLDDPILLCGTMFGLRTRRHRLFESNIPLVAPEHDEDFCRRAKHAKMGRPVLDGEYMHVVGNFTGVKLAREIMGIDWMTREGLRESIPPAYTEYIGGQLLEHLEARKAA